MIPDNQFIKRVPLTKEEIRAISLYKLSLSKDDIVADIGSGAGGMSVEIALRAKKVYSIDLNREAIENLKENLKKFNIKNCEIIHGKAEEAIKNLEFNKAFIGGTKNIEEIIKILAEKEVSHIVANTIVLENTLKIVKLLESYNYKLDIVLANISKAKKISPGYIFFSHNPIYIITALL
ncbi:precorrin-6Y C5,15-methyltransferase (decarboxylating) subunit CbiT [Methanocaldococcus infernus]